MQRLRKLLLIGVIFLVSGLSSNIIASVHPVKGNTYVVVKVTQNKINTSKHKETSDSLWAEAKHWCDKNHKTMGNMETMVESKCKADGNRYYKYSRKFKVKGN